jgi:hypothetical protein
MTRTKDDHDDEHDQPSKHSSDYLACPSILDPLFHRIIGFFGTSLVLVFLALAVKAGSAQHQGVAKALGLVIGSIAGLFFVDLAEDNVVNQQVALGNL